MLSLGLNELKFVEEINKDQASGYKLISSLWKYMFWIGITEKNIMSEYLFKWYIHVHTEGNKGFIKRDISVVFWLPVTSKTQIMIV